MIQFKLTDAHKELGDRYKGMGYSIQYDIDGIHAYNELELIFIPLKEAKIRKTKKTKTK